MSQLFSGSRVPWVIVASPMVVCLGVFGLMVEEVGRLSETASSGDLAEIAPILGRTLVFALFSSAAQTIIGLLSALAVLWCARSFWERIALVACYYLPYAVPSALVGLAYRFAIGPRGSFAEVMRAVFGIDPAFWLLENPLVAATVASAWQFAPFAFLLSYLALRSTPRRYLDAARIDGAPFWSLLIDIVLRRILPILISIFFLRLVFMIGKYDTPYIFTKGISSIEHVASVEIYPAFQSDAIRGLPATLTLVVFGLSVITAGLYLIARRFQKD
jgi:multiple sugar transport system permease protein